ncbi:MAG TPA: RcnB family protein [Caulobacteraceae bacterium]|jgi:Ni/Co efflux regulator RcnB
MKKWLLVAGCLALNLPALADAQPDQGRGDRQGAQGQGGKSQGGKSQSGKGQSGKGQSGQPEQGARPGQGGAAQGRPGNAGPNRPGNGGPGQGNGGRPEQGRPNQPGAGPNRPTPEPNRPGGPNRPGVPSRPTNPPRPSRPNWGWNGHRFRGGTFRYPAGWTYRRWGIGQFLPLLFLSPTYYYNDWGTLGIAPPPPGYRWVRFGPDLLLVQIGTGYIDYVIHNVFY